VLQHNNETVWCNTCWYMLLYIRHCSGVMQCAVTYMCASCVCACHLSNETYAYNIVAVCCSAPPVCATRQMSRVHAALRHVCTTANDVYMQHETLRHDILSIPDYIHVRTHTHTLLRILVGHFLKKHRTHTPTHAHTWISIYTNVHTPQHTRVPCPQQAPGF